MGWKPTSLNETPPFTDLPGPDTLDFVKYLVFFICCSQLSMAFAADDSAFVPSNPPEMKRLEGTDSPAHQAAKLFLRGANLGNYLESPRGSRGVTITAGDFTNMKREGFDHVRIPVRWSDYVGAGPEFTLTPEIFDRADFAVSNALAARLAVILNIHNFDTFTSDPTNNTAEFLAIWRQIAAHYAKFPHTLAFELLNEPKDAATTEVINPVFSRAIAGIRKTNPDRTIFVGPGKWNQTSELKNLVLPAEDNNLIVTVHCYQPFYFTHQGATWAGPDVKELKGIRFPGPPAEPLATDPARKMNPWVLDWIDRYNRCSTETNPCSPVAFAGELKLARAWSDYYGRPMHVGEFGAFIKADPESRARFCAAFRHECDADKLGWAIWDWNSNFRYWDEAKWRAVAGMHEALFGKD